MHLERENGLKDLQAFLRLLFFLQLLRSPGFIQGFKADVLFDARFDWGASHVSKVTYFKESYNKLNKESMSDSFSEILHERPVNRDLRICKP